MLKPTFLRVFTISVYVVAATGSIAIAQSTAAPPQDPMRLPPITVNVYKEPEDAQTLPVSVTAVPYRLLRDAGISKVSEAGMFAPNTFFSEFTARKLSNARFRGIGASPANPAISTYVDGVPQLNSNSSSIELTDVEQIEFVRGPQSALYGRNALGGLIGVTSRRPSSSKWSGSVTVPVANYSDWDARAGASGPLGSHVAVGLTLGKGKREGFTVNDITGNDLDSRDLSYGKAQFVWTPGSAWETRFIASGERARDGDYALNDLAALRQNPFHAARDFEGFTNRDIWSTTLQNRYEGAKLAFSSTTAFVKWKTRDLTDLDYTPAPLIRRDNSEKDLQFTQEFRLASSAAAPVKLGDNIRIRWQTGVFFFTQDYDQDAINNFSPGLISPLLPFPISQHSPLAALDDVGVGVYGQATTTFSDSFDLTVGARVDHENKEADLNTFYNPSIAPPNAVTAEKSFSQVSPNFAASYRFGSKAMLYTSVARGFKAGGFNPTFPPSGESYAEENAWHVEGGVKSLFADGKVSVNASVFFIDWNSLQLNVPVVFQPGQFYIANVGGATSKGVEFEVTARPHRSLDLFGSLGFTHARFAEGTASSGVFSFSGNKLPSTPDQTLTLGAQFTRAVSQKLTVYGRGEVAFNGGFEYDEANSQRQDSYSLTTFRAGVRGKYAFVDGWVKNAFDTRYIPIAFAYGNFAPSGFVGEMGAPRRFGMTLGVTF